MKAEDAEALFSAAYDAELSAEEQLEFEQALAQSEVLRERYREFRAMLDTLRYTSDAAETPDLLKGVQRRLRVQSGGRFYADRFSERAGLARHHLMLVLLAAALLLLMLFAVATFLGDPDLLP